MFVVGSMNKGSGTRYVLALVRVDGINLHIQIPDAPKKPGDFTNKTIANAIRPYGFSFSLPIDNDQAVAMEWALRNPTFLVNLDPTP